MAFIKSLNGYELHDVDARPRVGDVVVPEMTITPVWNEKAGCYIAENVIDALEVEPNYCVFVNGKLYFPCIGYARNIVHDSSIRASWGNSDLFEECLLPYYEYDDVENWHRCWNDSITPIFITNTSSNKAHIMTRNGVPFILGIYKCVIPPQFNASKVQAVGLGTVCGEGVALSEQSFAINGICTGVKSFALVSGHASGYGSIASGKSTEASGTYASVFGQFSKASGAQAFATGNFCEATGRASFACGNFSKNTQPAQFVVGYSNDPQVDSIFEVGNGLNASGQPNNGGNIEPVTRQNAFRVTQGGVAVAQTGLQIGNTLVTEAQLQALLALLP